MYSSVPAPLALAGLGGVPLDELLVGLVALAALVLVVRLVLGLVWKALLVGALAVSALYVVNAVAAV